jgi:FlaA1/EpsC-like NDP-sugar epimerase
MKRLVVVGLDMMMAVFAMWLAFSFRLDTPHWPEGSQWVLYALAPALAVPIFLKFGLYRAIFRYTGLAALVTTAQAVIVYGIALFVLILTMQHRGMVGLPRTTGILQPLIFLLMVGCSRAIARFWLAGLAGKNRRAAGRLLIYGAGSAGAQTASAIGNAAQYALMGFLDDDPAKSGSTINGIPVFLPKDAQSLVKRLGITDILLALPSARRERRNQILQSLCALPVHIRTLPGLTDLASGRVSVQDFRELEIEDLLGRDPVIPDTTLLSHKLMGQIVLVTGAGGSIGSELCRQIVKENPKRLLLVDQNEFGLYSIHQELIALCDRNQPVTTVTPLLGNVTNHRRMDEICRAYRPSIVYHTAAYKHVPMVEQNPAEGIANNVFGTLSLARAALENQVEQFVLISTDKAVRPTNLMGASKRVAELILQALANSPSVEFPALGGAPTNNARLPCGQTRFVMVRFGNVLGSSGSVVPLFRKQLELGGPLTVTHPEVIRYFMTVTEAAQLVLQAGVMAEGGEVLVLDMGEPVRIYDLAKRMITLSGLTLRDEKHPHGDIDIVFTGLRPAEKLYEELLIGENPQPTAHPRIMRAWEDFVAWPDLVTELSCLDQAVQSNDVATMKEILRSLVAESHLTDVVFDHISLAEETIVGHRTP